LHIAKTAPWTFEGLAFTRDEPVCEPKQDWNLDARAFQPFLKWLDQGVDSAGQNYLAMRQRLVAYFDRKNCPEPDELADETLNRVARRLEEEGAIASETPAKYCYIVARFVFMEDLRAIQKKTSVQSEIQRQTDAVEQEVSGLEDRETKAKFFECLDRCLEKLAPPNREVILRYYTGKERVKIDNRRALAEELGITTNALSIRACRIRDKLETCVRDCAKER
jgi:DNA-directed RNA polymerase specialized sigma24 family protein